MLMKVNIAAVVFLDLSEAFDSVQHDKLEGMQARKLEKLVHARKTL